MSEWWDQNSKIPYRDEKFQKIIDFYLFNCPVTIEGKKNKKPIRKKVSQRAVTFENNRWTGNHLTSLLRIMKANVLFKEATKWDEVKNISDTLEGESVRSDPYFEMIVYYPTIGKTKSIFYSIRNAFAHGSFSVVRTKKCAVYCFEAQKDGELRARIRLKENTLLHWMELFENGPRGLESYKTKKHRTKARV